MTKCVNSHYYINNKGGLNRRSTLKNKILFFVFIVLILFIAQNTQKRADSHYYTHRADKQKYDGFSCIGNAEIIYPQTYADETAEKFEYKDY